MAGQGRLARATIFVMDAGSRTSSDYAWVKRWLERRGPAVRVENYSTGGWEHLWDVEGTPEAIAEIPDGLLTISDWSRQSGQLVRDRKDRRHGRR